MFEGNASVIKSSVVCCGKRFFVLFLLQDNPCQQMVIFLKDTSAADLNAIVEFVYKGSVNVPQSQLASFVKTAEMLQIRGLSGVEYQVSCGKLTMGRCKIMPSFFLTKSK